jgi:hypothetical protein
MQIFGEDAPYPSSQPAGLAVIQPSVAARTARLRWVIVQTNIIYPAGVESSPYLPSPRCPALERCRSLPLIQARARWKVLSAGGEDLGEGETSCSIFNPPSSSEYGPAPEPGTGTVPALAAGDGRATQKPILHPPSSILHPLRSSLFGPAPDLCQSVSICG